MGTREDQRLRTRRAILVAAAHEFELLGYQATSYSSIAQRAGVTKSLVSYHFASKSDIVEELFASAFSRDGLFPVPPARPMDPLEDIAHSTVVAAAQEQRDPVARAALKLQREAHLIDVPIPPPYVGWATRLAEILVVAITVGHLPAATDAVFEANMLVAQYVGIRDLAQASGVYDDLMERTVSGTLDRFVAMHASDDAVLRATERAVQGMLDAEGKGVERIRARLSALDPDSASVA